MFVRPARQSLQFKSLALPIKAVEIWDILPIDPPLSTRENNQGKTKQKTYGKRHSAFFEVFHFFVHTPMTLSRALHEDHLLPLDSFSFQSPILFSYFNPKPVEVFKFFPFASFFPLFFPTVHRIQIGMPRKVTHTLWASEKQNLIKKKERRHHGSVARKKRTTYDTPYASKECQNSWRVANVEPFFEKSGRVRETDARKKKERKKKKKGVGRPIRCTCPWLYTTLSAAL